jgi:hypothetical protein
MASCPPPDFNLGPPPSLTIDFLNGKLKVPATAFYDADDKRWKSSMTYVGMAMGKLGQKPVLVTAKQAEANVTRRDHRGVKTFDNDIVGKIHERSKAEWKNKPGDYKVAFFMSPERGQANMWVTQVGPHKVPKMPEPNETVGHFRARGGYLFRAAMWTGEYPIDWIRPSWVDKHDPRIDHFQLFYRDGSLYSRPDGRRVSSSLTIKVVAPSLGDKAWDAVVKAVRWACNKVTNDKLQAAAATAAALGVAAAPASPYLLGTIAAWQAVAAACNHAWPSCPKVDLSSLIKPIQGMVMKPGTTYPAGSIARQDGPVYRIAVPLGLQGLMPTHVEIVANAATLPATVPVVGRFAYERATRPLWKRTSFLLGSGAGVATAAAALLILRRR